MKMPRHMIPANMDLKTTDFEKDMLQICIYHSTAGAQPEC
eukprot:gene18596-6038_t